MSAPAPTCAHHSADPRMCPDCRNERLARRAMPGVTLHLVDAPAPGPLVELVDADPCLDEDLQRTLGRLRCVAITWEDAAALYRAATRHRRGGRLAADVSVRVATVLTEAFDTDPSLRPEAANAIPPGDMGSDHGDNSTGVDPERPP